VSGGSRLTPNINVNIYLDLPALEPIKGAKMNNKGRIE
jgi:hypothetical protein